MKSLAQTISEAAKVNQPLYAYKDTKECIIYTSLGYHMDPKIAMSAFLDCSSFAKDSEFFTVQSITGLSKGEAVWLTGWLFYNEKELNEAWARLLETKDEDCEGDWDTEGVLYVSDASDVACLIASALNGGAKMTPAKLVEIYSKMEKIA